MQGHFIPRVVSTLDASTVENALGQSGTDGYGSLGDASTTTWPPEHGVNNPRWSVHLTLQ